VIPPQQPLLVAMLGARMHYAVPRILHQAGRLEMFFTDLCASRGWPQWLGLIPPRLQPRGIRRICSRLPAGIPPDHITAFNWFGVEYVRRRTRSASPAAMTATFLWANRRFGELVCGADWSSAQGVFTFNCAGLEILERAKRAGLRAIMEQTIAPSALEQRLLREERELHPGWEPNPSDEVSSAYSEREQAEWLLADVILCGSEFVRVGIQQCGGPVEKCLVVPYGVDIPSPHRGEGGRSPDEVEPLSQKAKRWEAPHPGPLPRAERENRILRVLTVGAVGLRKGAPYVLEAARRLKGKAEFRWVGAVNLSPDLAAKLGRHVELTGSVPHAQMAAHYEWADVFLLPSICEGSATATYEALGWGLPVVCTPNTGSIIRNGMEGFIVPIRDNEAMAEKLALLAADPALRAELSRKARNRAEQFTVEAYGEALLNSLQTASGVTL
jgi:glycosyltransferase involved in cell wall biosynthesis